MMQAMTKTLTASASNSNSSNESSSSQQNDNRELILFQLEMDSIASKMEKRDFNTVFLNPTFKPMIIDYFICFQQQGQSKGEMWNNLVKICRSIKQNNNL